MLVQEFNNNYEDGGIIDKRFYDCIPTRCPDCGMPLEMSESLTGLHCSNDRCCSKVAQRLIALASSLGVKDLGEARAMKFVKYRGITNPLMIFKYTPDVDGAMAEDISLDVSNKIINQFKQKNKFTLAEYVRAANLPNIQMSAFNIFSDFDDLDEAYNAIESGGVTYVMDKLNIKGSQPSEETETVSVRAVKVLESLVKYKEDLKEAIDGVSIIKIHNNNMTTIKAVCSDEVGAPFKTKADFYATCNNNYPNVHIEFGNSVTKKTEYLVWAGADGGPARLTNKAKKAQAYKEAGVPIQIVTAKQFIEILENL